MSLLDVKQFSLLSLTDCRLYISCVCLIISVRANFFSLRGQPLLLAKLGGDLLTTEGAGVQIEIFPIVAPSSANLRGGI